VRRALWAVLYLAATWVLGSLLAFGWWAFTAVVLGETECESAECGALGEFTDERWGLIVAVLIVASAVALWPVFRPRFRRSVAAK
jgi:hypothetical protein